MARVLACALACALLWHTPALARNKPTERPKTAADHRPDGQAETWLIEIYRLIGSGQTQKALQRAGQLVQVFPNFQLGQLVYGDLLATRVRPVTRMGDVPDTLARANTQQLQDLREESQLRIKALTERPPVGSIPSAFLQLSPRNRHAIAVDVSRARVYLFENSAAGVKLIADYYMSVGKLGVDKRLEGDQKTPLGVYFITSKLDPTGLRDFYGSGALPINYPNPVDQRLGRTGSGIWLHGTPPEQFVRAARATDGCIVVSNPDLQRILRTVEVRSTPVVIAQQLQWVNPSALTSARQNFMRTLDSWRAAKSSGNRLSVLSHYASDFDSYGKNLVQYGDQIDRELRQTAGGGVELKDLSLLQWQEGATPVMVVTFGELAQGRAVGAVKRQYWMQLSPLVGNAAMQGQWKIVFEGVIG
jgi:L,D-transpeptidase YnhG